MRPEAAKIKLIPDNAMDLKIKNEVVKKMIELAQKDAPLEVCGYLGGKGNTISEIFPVENIDKSSIHYTMAPEDQFRVIKEARKNSIDILAVYHSHPETPARMSDEDIRLAYDKEINYIILSLFENKNDIRSFSVKSGNVREEKLEVI